jgi:DNA mismatch endonuclease (patch repair protein)
MDRVCPSVRSRIMAAVKSIGTRAETRLARILWQNNLRGYRKHWPVLGKPDFVWPKAKVALFVDGCFWHGCLRCNRRSKSNVKFWRSKIDSNRRRDALVARKLRKDGWSVLRVWECRISEERTLSRIMRAVQSK